MAFPRQHVSGEQTNGVKSQQNIYRVDAKCSKLGGSVGMGEVSPSPQVISSSGRKISTGDPHAGRRMCNGAWRSEGLQVASCLLPSKWHYHDLILWGMGTGITGEVSSPGPHSWYIAECRPYQATGCRTYGVTTMSAASSCLIVRHLLNELVKWGHS